MAKTSASKKKSLYSEHPAVAMEAKVMAGLQEKTGKSLEQWLKAVKGAKLKSTKERAQWLKDEHGLGTNYAKWIAERAETGAKGGRLQNYKPDALVDKMFAGPKAELKPLYDHLVKLALKLGKDVTITPCSTIVPLRRRYVFAQIKPSTNARIDLGFALQDTRSTGRLIDTGGRAKGDRITHRIAITSLADIDSEVKGWLKMAYDLDA